MNRRRKHQAHENHERWLVSYADFITLLFAFFVVMFASSQADKGRAKQVAESVQNALAHGAASAAIAKVSKVLGGTVDDTGQGNAMLRGPGGAKRAPEEQMDKVVELLPSMKRLSADLEEEIKAGKIEMNLEPRGLVISLKEAAFFASGDDLVDPKSFSVLERLSGVLRSVPNEVRLEGHTDSVPINTPRFKSNWELSAARAIAMLDVLTKRFRVPQQRLAVAGYADRSPIDSNDSEEGRARNRRVDIVLLSAIGMRPESQGANGTPRREGSNSSK